MSTQIRGVKADFNQPTSVPAKPSASVILLRERTDGTQGLELLMLKRNEQLSFSPGFWVFPGGALEPQEQSVLDNGNELEIDQAFKLAAIRETFEESRVLLAKSAHDSALTDDEYEQFCTEHGWPSLANDFAFSHYLSELAWTPDIGGLQHLSTWTTPVQAKKRFLTRFYVAFMPPGQVPDSDGGETTEAKWQSLSSLKALIESEELKLMFPTEMNIQWLSQFDNRAQLQAQLIDHRAPEVMPRMEKHPEGVMLNIPIEAGYGISQRLMRV